jgi:hypothetical protein
LLTLDSKCDTLGSSLVFFLISLCSFRRYFFNDIEDVVIGALLCLWRLFFTYFLSFSYAVSFIFFWNVMILNSEKLKYYVFRNMYKPWYISDSFSKYIILPIFFKKHANKQK